MFTSIFSDSINTSGVIIASLSSILMGFILSQSYIYKNSYSKGFVSTLILLPFSIQVVIMMVNGNLGTSVAILGAFGLIRFRSIAGSARDIGNIFLAMAIGLANGMGHVYFAIFILVLTSFINYVLFTTSYGEEKTELKELRITIPENLNYESIFDDLLKQYTLNFRLDRVKTTNMGSLYELRYFVEIDHLQSTKELFDELRIRNGNLPIVCGYAAIEREAL